MAPSAIPLPRTYLDEYDSGESVCAKIIKEAVKKIFRHRYEPVSVEEESLALSSYGKFKSSIITLLYDEPIEDGISHPAEDAIKNILKKDQTSDLDSIRNIFLEYIDINKSLAADILKVLGRIELPGSSEWRYSLIKIGLKSESLEVRDAAMRVIENWEESTLIELLKKHVENIDWLKEYQKGIIADLS